VGDDSRRGGGGHEEPWNGTFHKRRCGRGTTRARKLVPGAGMGEGGVGGGGRGR
jgi:hypothetical protein